MAIQGLVLAGLALLLSTCDQNPANGENDPPWSHFGLADYPDTKLRLFDDQLYAITKQKGLYRKNVLKENADWTYLGFADTVHEWPYTEGVFDVYLNPGTPRRLMVSIYTNGYKTDPSIHTVYVSRDDGATWESSDSGLVYQQDDSWYHALPGELVGIGDQVYALCASRGIYVSEDFGGYWQLLRYIAPEISFHSLRIHPENPQIMWVIHSGGPFGGSYILKSSDGGMTWQGFSEPLAYISEYIDDLELHPQDVNTVFLGAGGIVYKTEDLGDTWVQILSGASLDINFSWITIDDQQPDHILVLGTNNTVFRSILESWDGGASWTEINYPYEFKFYLKPIYDSLNEAFYFATEGGVLKYKSSE